ncbi:MAG TPA: IS481 family transposase [Solirubrobacteraceae bacterium]|nr:IS481 family transposase [Solirubrobacteraceae bacterium]
MKLHGNARSCPKSRKLLVERIVREKWSLNDAAEAAGVSDRTARKWLTRFREEGAAGLRDRSSAPKRIPHRTPAGRVEVIKALRHLRMTAAEIAEALGMALSTVSLWLKRIGLGKRSRLNPPEPPNRYERRQPGELVHVDVKRLGRFKVAGKRVIGGRHGSRGYGWDYVHVMVDDCSRLAYAEVLGDQQGHTAAGFLRRGLAWFATLGVHVQRVMTDNGACYLSATHAIACRQLGLRHLRTQPYRPRTNGKAERFIQTLQNEWAYGRLYGNSAERATALPTFLTHYNFKRRHGSLNHQPPASKLNNLLRNYT